MDDVSTFGRYPQAKTREHRAHAIGTGRSRYGTENGSNEYPIFSPLNVEPNAYANYRRKYYEDYDALKKPSNREVLSYKGSRSMPQARYQFADPRYQNFSAAVHASYENIAHLGGVPSYASSDYSTFARGGAKAKSVRYLTNRNRQNPKTRDSNTNSKAAKKNGWTKKKTMWVISLIFIILVILAAIATIVYFTVFASNGKRDCPKPMLRRLKITFSFPMGYESRSEATSAFERQDIFKVIQGVILKFNDASTMFALQPYAGRDNASIIQTAGLAAALRVLDRLFEEQYSANMNPNLTAALCEYNSMIQKDAAFMHSLVAFAPETTNYDSVNSFHNDISTAANELNEVAAITAPDNTSVVMVCDGNLTEIFRANSSLVNVINDTDKDSVTVLDLVMRVLKPQVVTQTTSISSTTTTSSPSSSVPLTPSSTSTTSTVQSSSTPANPDGEGNSTAPTIGGKSERITFAFNIAHYNSHLRSKRSISKQSFEVIEGIVLGYLNSTTRFTFQPYGGVGHIPAVECANAGDALTKLEDISQLDVSGENPNMTSAILEYCNEISTHTIDEHYSYVTFTPEESDYANISDFVQDMHSASKSIEELTEKQKNHSATVIITVNAEAAVYFRNAAGAKVVESSNKTIEEITANISSALENAAPTAPTVPPASTPTILNGSSYYPCSGDFIFVADASESVEKVEHRTGQYEAIMSITSHWTLDNSSTIRVSVASVGVAFTNGGLLVQPFYSNHTDVNNAVIRVAANLPGPMIAPMSVAEMLRRQYCDSASETLLREGAKTIFIIFSGWNGPAGVVNVIQKSSWLGCSTAINETIFMASVESGSSDLASLGVPSSSLYYKVEDFSEKSIEELSTKIASEVCGVKEKEASFVKESTVLDIGIVRAQLATH